MDRGNHTGRSTSTTRGSSGPNGSVAHRACKNGSVKGEDTSSFHLMRSPTEVNGRGPHVCRPPEVNHGRPFRSYRRSGRRSVLSRRRDTTGLGWDTSAAAPQASSALLNPTLQYRLHSCVSLTKGEVCTGGERSTDICRPPPTHVKNSSRRTHVCLRAAHAVAVQPPRYFACTPEKTPLDDKSVLEAPQTAVVATSAALSLRTAAAAMDAPICSSLAAVPLTKKSSEGCYSGAEKEELETVCCSRELREGEGEYVKRNSVSSEERNVALLESYLRDTVDTSKHIHSAQVHAARTASCTRRGKKVTAAARKELQQPLRSPGLSQQRSHERHRHRVQQKNRTTLLPLQHQEEHSWQRQQQERPEHQKEEVGQLQQQDHPRQQQQQPWQYHQVEEVTVHKQQLWGQHKQPARLVAHNAEHQEEEQPPKHRRSQERFHHRSRCVQQQETRRKHSVDQLESPSKEQQQHGQAQQEQQQPQRERPQQEQQLQQPLHQQQDPEQQPHKQQPQTHAPQPEQLDSGLCGTEYMGQLATHSGEQQQLLSSWNCEETHAAGYSIHSLTPPLSLNEAEGGHSVAASQAAAAAADGLSPSRTLGTDRDEEVTWITDQQHQREVGESWKQQQEQWQDQQQKEPWQPQQQQQMSQEQQQRQETWQQHQQQLTWQEHRQQTWQQQQTWPEQLLQQPSQEQQLQQTWDQQQQMWQQMQQEGESCWQQQKQHSHQLQEGEKRVVHQKQWPRQQQESQEEWQKEPNKWQQQQQQQEKQQQKQQRKQKQKQQQQKQRRRDPDDFCTRNFVCSGAKERTAAAEMDAQQLQLKKQKKLESLIRQVLELLGEDVTREGLRKTPARFAAAIQYFTSGSFKSLKDVVRDAIFTVEEGTPERRWCSNGFSCNSRSQSPSSSFFFSSSSSALSCCSSGRASLRRDAQRSREARTRETASYAAPAFSTCALSSAPAADGSEEERRNMVIVKNIDVQSLCEHHLLPFLGHCHIAYVPEKHVVGLSKLARVTDLYARRLQLQERLTRQIALGVMNAIRPRGVAVVIECSHLCMRMRGVSMPDALTITKEFLGSFQEDATLREEFLSAIWRSNRGATCSCSFGERQIDATQRTCCA